MQQSDLYTIIEFSTSLHAVDDLFETIIFIEENCKDGAKIEADTNRYTFVRNNTFKYDEQFKVEEY